LHECFGAVELLAHIASDLRVEIGAAFGKLVGDGVGASLGKEGLAFEGDELFFDDTPHEVVGIGDAYAVAEGTLKAVGVEQAEEELEVDIFAVVRGGGHEEEVAGLRPKQFGEVISLGVFHLVAKGGG
jgi:hypothetical protein